MPIIWPMQPDRWLRRRALTSLLTPSEADRKRVTSLVHSLNPARYLLGTVASVDRAAEERDREEVSGVVRRGGITYIKGGISQIQIKNKKKQGRNDRVGYGKF